MTAMDIMIMESTEAIGTGIGTKGSKIIGDAVEHKEYVVAMSVSPDLINSVYFLRAQPYSPRTAGAPGQSTPAPGGFPGWYMHGGCSRQRT